jgi:HEAT repeat protein
MLELARSVESMLVLALGAAALAIGLALAFVLAQRVVLKAAAWRRVRVRARYQPALELELATATGEQETNVERLRRIPRRHRAVVAEALLEPLRVVRGSSVDRARLVADRIGLIDQWRRDLVRGSWSTRARAAHALGLMRDHDSVPGLVALLDSAHDEVRAAAVDALGVIGNVAAVQALLSRIGQQSRHQQARLVEALRRIGPAVTEAIVQHQATAAADRRLIAEVLALVGGTSARSTLLEWSRDDDAAVRAAAWRAIGVTGMDDRVAYHALRALSDPDSRVRAHAAQALGRAGRTDFVQYLAQHLDDEWEVAAQGARALSRLGEDGLAALRAREAAGTGGHGLELARHFLWERARA